MLGVPGFENLLGVKRRVGGERKFFVGGKKSVGDDQKKFVGGRKKTMPVVRM